MRSRGWIDRLPFRPLISRAANGVRRQVDRVDNAEVRHARRLSRLSRSGELDVLYFGDSTTSWIAPEDEDRRPLHVMIADLLGGEVRLHTVHGGSYNPDLYRGFLRVLDPASPPPVVIVPVCIRVRTVPWIEHPFHGRKQAISFLQTVDHTTPLRRIRAGFPPASAAELEQFQALAHPTWAGEWQIGDYLRALKAPAQMDEDWVRLLYAYHHGGRIPAGPALASVTALGAELRGLGSEVIAYQTPVPVQKGTEYYGEGFRRLAEENFAALERAFVAGHGPGTEVLPTGLVSPTEEFIDYRDASEHVNQHGRLRLAQAIVAAVHAVRSDAVS